MVGDSIQGRPVQKPREWPQGVLVRGHASLVPLVSVELFQCWIRGSRGAIWNAFWRLTAMRYQRKSRILRKMLILRFAPVRHETNTELDLGTEVNEGQWMEADTYLKSHGKIDDRMTLQVFSVQSRVSQLFGWRKSWFELDLGLGDDLRRWQASSHRIRHPLELRPER